MECVNCECTAKTMDGLEGSIRALLQRGKLVNRMMNDEKRICAARRAEEVQQLKKQLPKAPLTTTTTKTTTTANMDRTVTNSAKPNLMHFSEVDFDVSTLPTEVSEVSTPTSASVSIPRKTGSIVSTTSTTTETTTMTTEMMTTSSFKKGKTSSGLTFDQLLWFVDNDGGLEALPMKVHVKQHGSVFDVLLVLLDEHGEQVMDIWMQVEEGKVGHVRMCGKEAKLVN